jgi:hypothetical protein
MDDTGAIREKMLKLWTRFDNGKLSTGDARIHIGFARTVLETVKVQIAAAHLADVDLPVVHFESKRNNKRLTTQ